MLFIIVYYMGHVSEIMIKKKLPNILVLLYYRCDTKLKLKSVATGHKNMKWDEPCFWHACFQESLVFGIFGTKIINLFFLSTIR